MKLKWEDDGSIKTPLARARGLGSAHEGAGHWWHQRITAISNLFLMAWLAWTAAHMPGWTYIEFTSWLAQPLHAILMLLSVISVFYHAALGCQVIAEDYIHHEGLKLFKLVGIKLFFSAAAVACIFSILKIAFAG